MGTVLQNCGSAASERNTKQSTCKNQVAAFLESEQSFENGNSWQYKRHKQGIMVVDHDIYLEMM